MKEDNGRACKFLISSYDIITSSSQCGITKIHFISSPVTLTTILCKSSHLRSFMFSYMFCICCISVHEEPHASSLRGNNIFRNLIFLALPSITASERLQLICTWRNNKDYLRCFLEKLIYKIRVYSWWSLLARFSLRVICIHLLTTNRDTDTHMCPAPS